MIRRSPLLLGLPLLLGGCVGSDYAAFFTTDNLGVSIESTPSAQVMVNYGRTEGTITPVFEDGRTPALLAFSSHQFDKLLPLNWQHGSVFAGGPAAELATQSAEEHAAALSTSNKQPGRSTGAACVSDGEKPVMGWDGRALPEGRVSRPLTFVTTTSTGFRIALPTTAASGVVVPEAHLGFRRSEIALAPLLGQKGGCDGKDAQDGKTYQVHSPSFFSIAGGDANATVTPGGKEPGTSPTGGSFGVRSIFSTGTAAERVAMIPGVNERIRGAIQQKTEEALPQVTIHKPGPRAACLRDYIDSLPASERAAKQNALFREAVALAGPSQANFDFSSLRNDPVNERVHTALIAKHSADLASIPSCKN